SATRDHAVAGSFIAEVVAFGSAGARVTDVSAAGAATAGVGAIAEHPIVARGAVGNAGGAAIVTGAGCAGLDDTRAGAAVAVGPIAVVALLAGRHTVVGARGDRAVGVAAVTVSGVGIVALLTRFGDAVAAPRPARHRGKSGSGGRELRVGKTVAE